MQLLPFILGLVSSLHCVGMCGPIAILIPNAVADGNSTFGKLQNILLYNVGRIITYMLYGVIFGLIGRSFEWFGWQQQISIALGMLILIGLLINLFTRRSYTPSIVQIALMKIRVGLSRLLGQKTASSLVGIGILNGLLPCGMVYLALVGATTSGSALKGAFFMGAFGVGTIPAMASLAYFGSMLKPSFRLQARKLFPAMMAIMAVLLIVRGMNLGIPFLSPEIQTSTPVSCH